MRRLALRLTTVCEKTSVFFFQIYLEYLIKGRKVVYLTMQHISGISRQQIQISSLEDKITTENPIRFIEAFVENISLQALGFTTQGSKLGDYAEREKTR